MTLEESNNPGNLREVGIPWKGKIGAVRGFTKFVNLETGFRAMVKNANRRIMGGANTIATLITAWAPPHENDTKNYIAVVSKAVGLPSTTKVKINSPTLIKVCLAMVGMEHGNASKQKVYNAIKHLSLDQLLN